MPIVHVHGYCCWLFASATTSKQDWRIILLSTHLHDGRQLLCQFDQPVTVVTMQPFRGPTFACYPDKCSAGKTYWLLELHDGWFSCGGIVWLYDIMAF